MALPLRHDQIPAPLTIAARVIETEIAGLKLLQSSLNGAFTRAVDLLLPIKGRVIVTGIGKSGHVARKIAATLASTGTPAQYVHAGEASHGDLGMVTPDDAVLALSNSGEARELTDLIAYASRFGIPLIAMTAVETSPLARAATIVLPLPQAEEACTLGLAPTTSTTLMMVLGDALAVALLEKRGFSPEDYHVFHPGGKLGRSLVRVEALMHRGDDVPLASIGTKMSDVILKITAKRFGCAGIVDGEGKLIGIVTDGDLRRHIGPDLLTQTAETIMTPNPQVIAPDGLAGEALRLMTERPHPITVLFVVEDSKPVGILHVHDLLQTGVV